MLKFLFIILLISITPLTLMGQTINDNYDSTLARSLNADEYGMKNYFFVILKTGENKTEDKVVRDSAFSGHMENINRLAENGSLVLAGPLGENNNNYRGLFILNVTSMNEAKEILQSDPAIKEKFLEFEIYPWYGSASLQEVLKIHDKISKYKF